MGSVEYDSGAEQHASEEGLQGQEDQLEGAEGARDVGDHEHGAKVGQEIVRAEFSRLKSL